MKPDAEAALDAAGWVVECISPLEIRHPETGSFATRLAADAVVAALVAPASALPLDSPASAVTELQSWVGRCSEFCLVAANADNEQAWKTAYDLVFSGPSTRIADLLNHLGVSFSWCDPDGSYQDDVSAYVCALESRMQELEPFFAVYQQSN